MNKLCQLPGNAIIGSDPGSGLAEKREMNIPTYATIFSPILFVVGYKAARWVRKRVDS